MTGFEGHTAHALPHDLLLKAGRHTKLAVVAWIRKVQRLCYSLPITSAR